MDFHELEVEEDDGLNAHSAGAVLYRATQLEPTQAATDYHAPKMTKRSGLAWEHDAIRREM